MYICWNNKLAEAKRPAALDRVLFLLEDMMTRLIWAIPSFVHFRLSTWSRWREKSFQVAEHISLAPNVFIADGN